MQSIARLFLLGRHRALIVVNGRGRGKLSLDADWLIRGPAVGGCDSQSTSLLGTALKPRYSENFLSKTRVKGVHTTLSPCGGEIMYDIPFPPRARSTDWHPHRSESRACSVLEHDVILNIVIRWRLLFSASRRHRETHIARRISSTKLEHSCFWEVVTWPAKGGEPRRDSLEKKEEQWHQAASVSGWGRNNHGEDRLLALAISLRLFLTSERTRQAGGVIPHDRYPFLSKAERRREEEEAVWSCFSWETSVADNANWQLRGATRPAPFSFQVQVGQVSSVLLLND